MAERKPIPARRLERLNTRRGPVIGRVHGGAVGGGVGLAAVCDIVIAAEDAVFALSEVKLGILPAVISPYVIRKIGESAARELFLTGRRFSAKRAQEIGLVHEVVAESALDDAVNRRERTPGGPDGNTVLGWNPDELVDTQLTVLQARRSDEAPIATLVGYGCHPVTCSWDVLRYSADFPGPMRRLVRTACLASTLLAGPVRTPGRACGPSSQSSQAEQTTAKPAHPVRDAAKRVKIVVLAPFQAAALVAAIGLAGVRGRIESLRERSSQ